jgi:hypothetical protein
MALLWIEGWDNYAAFTDIYSRHNYYIANASSDPTFAAGRYGGQALSYSNNGERVGVRFSRDTTDRVYMGFAIKITDSDAGADTLMRFFSSSGSTNIEAFLDANTIFFGPNSTTPRVVTPELKPDAWHYVSFDLHLSNTGSIQLYLDGALVDSFTGDTLSAAANVRVVELYSASSRIYLLDDIYFGDDTAGSGPTAQFGDAVIEQLLPTADGAATQFTPSTGSNFQNVDDATPDDDTTYNSATSVGPRDMFTLGNLTSGSGDIHAVQTFLRVKKMSAGPRAVRPVVALSGSPSIESTEGEFGPTTDNYLSTFTDLFQSPAGSDWTVSDVNNIEYGYEVTG